MSQRPAGNTAWPRDRRGDARHVRSVHRPLRSVIGWRGRGGPKQPRSGRRVDVDVGPPRPCAAVIHTQTGFFVAGRRARPRHCSRPLPVRAILGVARSKRAARWVILPGDHGQAWLVSTRAWCTRDPALGISAGLLVDWPGLIPYSRHLLSHGTRPPIQNDRGPRSWWALGSRRTGSFVSDVAGLCGDETVAAGLPVRESPSPGSEPRCCRL